jgi:hypothetical protein
MENKETATEIDGYTKELVEKSYETKLTDKQWKMLVDFCEDEESVPDSIMDFMSKIDWLEELYDEYNETLVKIHGQKEADRINGK